MSILWTNEKEPIEKYLDSIIKRTPHHHYTRREGMVSKIRPCVCIDFLDEDDSFLCTKAISWNRC